MKLAISALFLTVILTTTSYAAAPKRAWRNCHHNAQGQLVCRHCWHEEGKVRCNQPRRSA